MTCKLKGSAGLAALVLGLFAWSSDPGVAQDSLTAPDVKASRPAPRTSDGHPDLSGYWKGTRDTKSVGNIA